MSCKYKCRVLNCTSGFDDRERIDSQLLQESLARLAKHGIRRLTFLILWEFLHTEIDSIDWWICRAQRLLLLSSDGSDVDDDEVMDKRRVINKLFTLKCV